MPMRKNAGRGLAQITELVHTIAMDNAPNAVGAIGHVDVYPNSRNIIPGKVVFTVDFRSHEIDTLTGMVERLMAEAPKLCADLGIEFSAEIVGQFDPPEFDKIVSKRSAMLQNDSAIRTWISFPALAMMLAG